MVVKTQTNYRDLLAQPTDQFVRPPALPEGHFHGSIKAYEFGKSAKKGTPQIQFIFNIVSAGDDVDEEEMAGIDLSNGKEMRTTFYITPNALWRLTQFLDGVLGEETDKSFDERIPETRGVDVLIRVSQRTSDDGEETFNDVREVIAE